MCEEIGCEFADVLFIIEVIISDVLEGVTLSTYTNAGRTRTLVTTS
jgi:hypothetical protein